METGWRPYSFVIGEGDNKKYVEYRRLDPFATILGIAADSADILGQVDDKTGEEVGVAALTAVMNNLGSKTYLQGGVDLAQAVSGPEMFMQRYVQRLTTSFMPYSGAIRESRRFNDDAMREVRSILDAIKDTVPGYSATLPARRSMITGEPITLPKGFGEDAFGPLADAYASMQPIYESEYRADTVLDELAQLGEGVTGYPSRKLMGVELTPEQYSEYTALHGQYRNPSTHRTLYQELERVFNSAAYDRGRDRYADDSDPSLNPRIKMVRKVITNYRQAARNELLQRHPDLRRAVQEREAQAVQNGRSMLSGIAELGAD